MRNKYFLIYVLSIFVIEVVNQNWSFMIGHTQWERVTFSGDVRGMTDLFTLVFYIFIGSLLYEPKVNE